MYYSDDPGRDFDRWDAEQERRLARTPVCSLCNNHIQDETFYLINDEPVCEGCLRNYFLVFVEDYIE